MSERARERGLSYRRVAVNEGSDIELPTRDGMDVRLTDREVILTREDRPGPKFQAFEPGRGIYPSDLGPRAPGGATIGGLLNAVVFEGDEEILPCGHEGDGLTRRLSGRSEGPAAVRAERHAPLGVGEVKAIGPRPCHKCDLLSDSPPVAPGVGRAEESRIGRRHEAIGLHRIDGKIEEGTGRFLLGPAPASVAADQEAPARAVGAIDRAPRATQDMEVDLADKRHRSEGAATITGLDQSEVRWEVLLALPRMAGAQ